MNDPNQFELAEPPLDGITNICFNQEDPKYLLVSSWDKVIVTAVILRVLFLTYCIDIKTL
jgi:hypothetical protein